MRNHQSFLLEFFYSHHSLLFSTAGESTGPNWVITGVVALLLLLLLFHFSPEKKKEEQKE